LIGSIAASLIIIDQEDLLKPDEIELMTCHPKRDQEDLCALPPGEKFSLD
jgi:hypothetical protein